jgi:hypothetical protein
LGEETKGRVGERERQRQRWSIGETHTKRREDMEGGKERDRE